MYYKTLTSVENKCYMCMKVELWFYKAICHTKIGSHQINHEYDLLVKNEYSTNS